ncbi:MAG: hypothetical protein IT204_04315 [Fimbriimonadaceae bacterium]|nr:hypothetical protein [Fimbriimonadaceae bacterium]
MIEKRPPAVLLAAAWQVLLGVTWLVQAFRLDSPIFLIALCIWAIYHLATAVGLYQLQEWARRRAVQMAVFDILGVLQGLLAYPSPFGALVTLGMPIYTLTVLNDPALKQRFS